MGLPLSYSFRNLWARRLTTFLTASGMALVVFVFTAILMMAEGLKKTLVETGSPDNVMVLRKGSSSEVQSGIERIQASIIETQSEVATGAEGRRLLAKEAVVLISLPKRENNKAVSNVVVRGIGESSLALRPKVKLIQGRVPRPGLPEIMAGQKIAERFQGGGLGETLRFGLRDWTVVGVFDAGNTGFSSEVWGDAEQLMQAFRRPVYSTVIFRIHDPSQFQPLKNRLESDPRLNLEAKRENRYYAEQSEIMSKFLSILGLSLTIIFSFGAMLGAMITMYSSVASRTSEVGTLRALGFQRGNILRAFLYESLFLGMIGGLVGLFLGSFMQLITISTMNFQTFSELAFSFTLTWEIAWKAMAFSLGMGLVGGLLPSVQASRMNIVDSLRAQ
jgi:ABC-type antimicrobial peptide transport system permease subunit